MTAASNSGPAKGFTRGPAGAEGAAGDTTAAGAGAGAAATTDTAGAGAATGAAAFGFDTMQTTKPFSALVFMPAN